MTPENVAKVRELRQEGLSVEKIAAQLGLSRGAVQYQLLSPERRAKRSQTQTRANRVAYVTYDCPGCGDEMRIQKDSRDRQKREGRPGHCRDCVRALRYRGCIPERQEVVATDWMSPEERLDPKVWAERVAAMMSPAELREINAAMDLLALERDGSRHARRGGPRSFSEPLRWYEALPAGAMAPSVDKPFGKSTRPVGGASLRDAA